MEVRSLQVSKNKAQAHPNSESPRRSKDWLRRMVWWVLSLYLAPVVLLVLFAGGLTMGVLVLVRVLGRIIRGSSNSGRGYEFASSMRPHIGIVSDIVPR